MQEIAMTMLEKIRADLTEARLASAQGSIVDVDVIDVDFPCPMCNGLASVIISLSERVLITPLDEDHQCFESLWYDLEDLPAAAEQNEIARAAMHALGVYYDA